MHTHGHSLIELTLVVTLIASIGVLLLPNIQSTLSRTHLEDATLTVLSMMRHSQRLSMTSHRGEAHGITCLSDIIISFEGSSYDGREQNRDTEYPLPTFVSCSNATEVVFQNGQMKPSAPALLTLIADNYVHSVRVTSAGIISRE